MDSGSHDARDDPWWSGQHHQQQADGAAARLPPLGPTSQPDQQHRPNNKRDAAAAPFAASQNSNDGNGGGDDDMMEEIESPEVRSFKRLKLEGGGYNNAGSSSASLSDDAVPQYGQRQHVNVVSGTGAAGSGVAMNNHHSHHAYQQRQMSHADTNLHAIHRPHPHNPRAQNHVGGRPPAVPNQHASHHHTRHHRYQAAGQHTADVGENHHTSRSSHEFAPIRANPYQLQTEPYRQHHQHHHSLPLPPSLPNAGVGPRCNSVTSNSTDQSAASYSGYPQYNSGNNLHATSNGSIDSMDSRSNGASYSGVNHMLGQLHAQRRMRQQEEEEQQTQSQAAHLEAPGHHRRNTLSPNWGLSANAVGGNGEGGASAMGAGQHPGPVGDLHHHPQHRQGHQQGQHGQHRNHGPSPSRQRVPSWRRKVQLPSSSNLY